MAAFDDDGLDDLMGEISFDSKSSSSKNPRGVVFSSGIDLATGALEGATGDLLGKIPEMVRAMMPDAIKEEYSKIESLVSDAKEELTKGATEIKDLTKDFSKIMSEYFPKDMKISKILREYGKKEGYGSDEEEKSAEQQEQDKVNAAVLEALGNSNQQQANATLVKEALDSKRHASSQQTLKEIFAEVKAFGTVGHKYYIKSLELQYKHLYKTAELVEITKTAWEANRRQIEGLISNTSLPDTVKLMALQEANDPRIRPRAREIFLAKYYKNFDPWNKLRENVLGNIRKHIGAIKSGIQGGIELASGGLDMMQMAETAEESGVGLTYMGGTMIGEWIRNKTLGRLGNRLGNTKLGKKLIYNTRNFVADPRAWLQDEFANRSGEAKGLFGKLKRKGFDYLRGLSGTGPERESVSFQAENLDMAKAFDGRAHQALVKVIPALLSKIHGAIIRAPEDKELIWDNKSGTLVTKGSIMKNIKMDLGHAVNSNGYRDAVEAIAGVYNRFLPKPLSEAQMKKLGLALGTFMMSPGGRVNLDTLASKEFAEAIKKSGLKVSGWDKATMAIITKAKNISDPDNPQRNIESALRRIRESLPSSKDRLGDLHKSGHMDLAKKLGMVTLDPATGTYTMNEEAHDEEILKAIGGINYSKEYDANRLYDPNKYQELKDKASEFFGAGKEKLKGALGKVASYIPGVGIAKKFMGTKTGQRLKKVGGTLLSPFSFVGNKLRRAGSKIADRIDREVTSLEDAMNADEPEAAVGALFTAKKTELASLMSKERLAAIPGQLKRKLVSSFKSAKDVTAKVSKDFINGARKISIKSVRETYRKAKSELDKLTKDFVEDARYSGVDVDKINNYKNQVKDLAKRTAAKAKSKGLSAGKGIIGGALNLAGRFIPGVGLATKIGSGLLNNRITRFGFNTLKGIGKRAKGLGSKLIGKGKDFLEDHEDTTLGDVIDGSKRAAENLKRKAQDETRSGSWRNRFKKWFSSKDAKEDDKKKSRFGLKSLGRTLKYGGLAFGAFMLIRKLGITMEDVVKFGKGVWNGVSTLIGTITPIVTAIATGVSKIMSFFTGDESVAANMGKLTAGGLGLLAASKIGLLGLGGKLAKGAFSKVTGLLKGETKKKRGRPPKKKSLTDKLRESFSKPKKRGRPPKKKTIGQKIGNIFTKGKSFIIDILKKAFLGDAGKKITKKLGPSGFKRVGVTIAKKVGSKALGIIGGAITGPIGWATAIVSIIFLGYDIFSIGRNYYNGDSLCGAIVRHYCGVNFIDDDDEDIPEGVIVSDEEANALVKENSSITKTEETMKEEESSSSSTSSFKPLTNAQMAAELNGYTLSSKDGVDIYSKDGTPIGVVDHNKGSYSIVSQTTNGKYTDTYTAYGPSDKFSTSLLPGLNKSNYTPPSKFVYEDIGSVSAWFESKNRPGIVSSGKGDFGGRSYGCWQLSSKTGTLANYLKQSRYKKYFEGTTINSPEFVGVWKQIAEVDPKGFRKDQFEFIKKTHYDVAVKNIKVSTGFDIDARSDALKSAIFSRAVHYGPGGGAKAFKEVLSEMTITSSTTDRELINALYDNCAQQVAKRFRSSSVEVQVGIYNRYKQERMLVLSLLPPAEDKKYEEKTKITVAGLPVGIQDMVDNTTTQEVPKDIQSFKDGEIINDAIVKTKLSNIDKPKSLAEATSYTPTKENSTARSSVNTDTNKISGSTNDLLKKQYEVQVKMLKELVTIAKNTDAFSKLQNSASTQQRSMMPQPAVNLERQEVFNL